MTISLKTWPRAAAFALTLAIAFAPGAAHAKGAIKGTFGTEKFKAKKLLVACGYLRSLGFFSIAGRFTIRAVYSGDATFDASSQSLTEQVNR